MKPIKIVFLLGILSITLPVLADGDTFPTNRQPSALTPQQFVSDAAVGGIKEIFLSEVALETSTNDDIKSFAKWMVKDHGTANKKLMKIAEASGLNLPSTNMFTIEDPNWNNPLIIHPESVKGAQLLTLTNLPYLTDYLDVKQLRPLTGRQFDDVYLSNMLSDHAQAVGKFEVAAKNLDDPELKKFAGKILPTLQKHYKMAQELNDKYNSASGTNTIHQPGLTVTPLPPI